MNTIPREPPRKQTLTKKLRRAMFRDFMKGHAIWQIAFKRCVDTKDVEDSIREFG